MLASAFLGESPLPVQLHHLLVILKHRMSGTILSTDRRKGAVAISRTLSPCIMIRYIATIASTQERDISVLRTSSVAAIHSADCAK
uniref:Wsv353 n=1 Tax=White spot syndrome virus TaxID=92652 RepID=A0A2U9GA60_WSSV|nr:wsv353 [Shrimp white spot syndrome virus]